MSVLTKAGERLAKSKLQASAFKSAYKKAPGQTLGTYAKTHKPQMVLGGATMLPVGHLFNRQSTHSGIDQKGGV